MAIHLTARMKAQAVAYARRAGVSMDDAATLARSGLLTSEGKLKSAGGKKSSTRRRDIDVSAAERRAFAKRFDVHGVRLLRDEVGYYVATGSRESDRYKSVGAIPAAAVEKVAGG